MKKIIITLLSRQPFVLLRGLSKKSLLACSYFDIRSKIEGPGVKIMPGTRVFANVEIGPNTYIGYGSLIAPGSWIKAYASIGNHVVIGGGDHGVSSMVLNSKISPHAFQERNKNKTVVVGADAWVGNGALIKSGVDIGRSSVIGMGAVVTRSTRPYSINIGVPARDVGARLVGEKITILESTRWWELSVKSAKAKFSGDADE